MHERPGRAGIHGWSDRWGNLGSGDLDGDLAVKWDGDGVSDGDVGMKVTA